ncbi:hypothetical protein AHiyo8_11930 [Arthrobacter sp. Hiyo8]|nr:hypothetical protein AHiyo8_11930 [Arthrobacter sp. Hiyo8]
MPASAPNTVSGTPTSPLYEPCGATVAPARERMPASRSLVVVLPAEPVMPMTVKGSPWAARAARMRRTDSAARAPMAITASSTTTAGYGRPSSSETSRSVSARTAPRSKAAPT